MDALRDNSSQVLRQVKHQINQNDAPLEDSDGQPVEVPEEIELRPDDGPRASGEGNEVSFGTEEEHEGHDLPAAGATCREAATVYATARGWHVLPLRPNTKLPLTKRGLHDSTTNPGVIDGWFDANPRANLAIRTGIVSRLVVVDVDIKNNAGGGESLAKLEGEHGQFATLTARTRTNGLHLFFLAPDGVAVKNSVGILPGIDVRGEGGYVVAAPSTIDGRAYTWVNPGEEVAPMPEWLVRLVTEKPKKKEGIGGGNTKSGASLLVQGLEGLKGGTRNDGLFKLACQLRRDGYSYHVALGIVRNVAAKCDPPLEMEEATRCLNNGYGYTDSYELSDLGNSERFLALHGGVLRFVPERERWIAWLDGRWQTESEEIIHQFGKLTVRMIADAAKGLPKGDEGAKAIRRFARQSESRAKLDAMLELASRESAVRVPERLLDADPLLIGVQNGVVDLRDQTFRDARPEDLITKRAGAAYDPDAGCPLWLGFLDRIMGGTAEMIGYLRRLSGYCLTGLTTERTLSIFVGSGANGKSTFLEVLRAVIGDYAIQTESATLMSIRGRSGGVRNDVARLVGARLVTSSESEEGARLAESLVKSLTGGDAICARFLFKEHFEYHPSFKIIMATNARPEVRGHDQAVWDRLHVVRFPVSIPREERDQSLREKLLAERAGVLRWAVEGCGEWRREGLRPPEEVVAATADFREDQDLLGQWIAQRCVTDLGPEVRTSSTALYEDFSSWLRVRGEEPVSHRVFGERLRGKGFVPIKSNTYFYVGIVLSIGSR